MQKGFMTPKSFLGTNFDTFIYKKKYPLALNVFFAFRPTVVHSTEVQQAVNLEPKCKVLCHNEIICRRHLCSNLQHVLTLSKGITAEWVLLVTHQYYFFQKFHIFFMVYGKSNQIIRYFEGWQGGTDPLPPGDWCWSLVPAWQKKNCPPSDS